MRLWDCGEESRRPSIRSRFSDWGGCGYLLPVAAEMRFWALGMWDTSIKREVGFRSRERGQREAWDREG